LNGTIRIELSATGCSSKEEPQASLLSTGQEKEKETEKGRRRERREKREKLEEIQVRAAK